MTIVTGFLGAGKTTLIRRFLATAEGRGTALVVNEFGSVGIDDALLRSSTDEVTLLGNGCICCNTRSDLQVALRKLVADRDRGKIPHFGRVLIETSGLADVSPILQTFSTDRALGSEFALEVVLTMVDAVAGLRNLDKAPEARKQAILADRLVVSKTDLAASKATATLIARLKQLNPRASIDLAVAGELDPHCLTDAGQESMAAQRTGFVADAAHSDGIVSFVLREDAPLDWPRIPAHHGDARRAAGAGSPARQGFAQSRRQPRTGGVSGGAAPHPPTGRTGRLARCRPVDPRGLHHAQRGRAPGARSVCRGARAAIPPEGRVARARGWGERSALPLTRPAPSPASGEGMHRTDQSERTITR